MIKKISTLLLATLISQTTIRPDSSIKKTLETGAAIAGGFTVVAGALNAWTWYCCYAYSHELYGNSANQETKHTWNLLDEVFPTAFTMSQARDESAAKAKAAVRTFKHVYMASPICLVQFILDAQTDYNRLETMKEALVGPNVLVRLTNKVLNNTILYGLKTKIEDVVDEIVRYQKRLSFIMHVITTSREYEVQLAQMQGSTTVNYQVRA